MGLRIADVKPDSPEWAIWRMKGIGASVAAAVLNECKFKTAYELFLELTNRKPGFDGNAATERGKELEPAARAAYEIEHDFVEAPPICIIHPHHDFIKASLDGYIAESKTILEIKCPSEASHKLALQGEVPRHYWIQTQHQLMCADNDHTVHYWSYYGNSGVKVIVKPDLEFQQYLLEAEFAFWELVQSDTPPPLTDRDTKIVETDEMKSLCESLLKIKDGKSTADKSKAEGIKSSIIILGGHRKVRCGRVLVSHSVTKTGKDSYRLTVGANE